MALSFEQDIKPMLERASGGCMLTNPVVPKTGERHPCKAFDIFDHIEVIKKADVILLELVLEKMPPSVSVPDFDYQGAAKLFAEWIDSGMKP
jgi:hypothetical protein